jgi:hypothetical protein
MSNLTKISQVPMNLKMIEDTKELKLFAWSKEIRLGLVGMAFSYTMAHGQSN